jgi:5-methylcytosine-specific restriction enzyme subunit McrC
MSIPIRNFYFMLLYAWDRLEEAGIVNVSAEDETSLLNLFTRILVAGTHHLLKRGLDRGDIAHSEDISSIQGKIDFSETLKRQLMQCAKLHCEFDELSHNILHNRILKTTQKKLLWFPDIDKKNRNDLGDLAWRLDSIEPVALSAGIFSRVCLHRNNSFYRFLMSLCEIIHNSVMVAEEEGGSIFSGF